jgi:bifunctional oligoribonuclease and PAP phosphatase NrnA
MKDKTSEVEVLKGFREEFWKMVEEANQIVITGHINPDDDSIASILAVYWLIKKRFSEKEVRMIYPGEGTSEWKYFENFSEIEFVKEVANEMGEKTDLLIMLDGGGFDRFSKNPKKLENLAQKTICIDHHKNKLDDFDLSACSSKWSATVEGVYELLMKDGIEVPRRLAEILLLGIVGDTGNFTFLDKEKVGVLTMVQELITKHDLQLQELQARYQQIPKRMLGLVGEVMMATKFFDETGDCPPFQVGWMSKEMTSRHKLSDREVSLISHLYMSKYLTSVKGYDWGFMVTPREGSICSVSFRSLPRVMNVRKIAEKFGGGGHDLASGGQIETDDPLKAILEILEVLKTFKIKS